MTALIARPPTPATWRGWRSPGDRRVAGVELRPATWQAFAEIYRPVGEQVWAATADLTQSERQAVVDAMTTMTSAFDDVRARMAPAAPAGRGR